MRDWNYLPCSLATSIPSCFDLTYEGLKQTISQSSIEFLQGFDLTYEGLKLERSEFPFTPERGSFDLTYEGLKPEPCLI